MVCHPQELFALVHLELLQILMHQLPFPVISERAGLIPKADSCRTVVTLYYLVSSVHHWCPLVSVIVCPQKVGVGPVCDFDLCGYGICALLPSLWLRFRYKVHWVASVAKVRGLQLVRLYGFVTKLFLYPCGKPNGAFAPFWVFRIQRPANLLYAIAHVFACLSPCFSNASCY